MPTRTCLSVILAAGEGTRMKSALPKVLHEIAGLPMVAHVVKAAEAAGTGGLALVIGHGAQRMREAAERFAPGAKIFVQEKRLGTAHAVLAAREAIAVGGFRTENPTGYGRLIEKDGRLVAIREEKDCSPQERAITFCNGGLMAIAGKHALGLLDAVGNENAKGEYYLTDIVGIAAGRGLDVAAVEASFENALGINNRAELAEAEAIWQKRRRREVMLSGVTLLAPETVYFSFDTEIGQDAVVEPDVWFGPGVTVAAGARIHAFSHIEGAAIGSNAEVGPFARLRPGAELGKKAKVGNFCEVKKAVVEEAPRSTT